MRARCVVLLGVALTAVCAGGCKRIAREAAKRALEAKDAGGGSGPPTLTWKDNEVSFGGWPTKGRFSLRGTSYQIWLSDLPADAKLTVAGKAVTPSSGGTIDTKVELGERVGALAPKDAFDTSFKLDPEIKLELALSPTAKVAFDAPPVLVWLGVGDFFKKAADAPVTFPGSTPPTEHTIVSLLSTVPEAIGPARSLHAVDWVALKESLPPRQGKTCSGYKKTGSESSPEKTLTVELVDQKVTVYELATSRVVATREFRAKDECPSMAFGGSARSYPSSEEQKGWLRATRAKSSASPAPSPPAKKKERRSAAPSGDEAAAARQDLAREVPRR